MYYNNMKEVLSMAKKQEDYLITEAKRIGFQTMLGDIEQLLTAELSQPQRVALSDQQTKIKELLTAL
jgi:hypothetical protein